MLMSTTVILESRPIKFMTQIKNLTVKKCKY